MTTSACGTKTASGCLPSSGTIAIRTVNVAVFPNQLYPLAATRSRREDVLTGVSATVSTSTEDISAGIDSDRQIRWTFASAQALRWTS
jgi:hypothetical protein